MEPSFMGWMELVGPAEKRWKDDKNLPTVLRFDWKWYRKLETNIDQNFDQTSALPAFSSCRHLWQLLIAVNSIGCLIHLLTTWWQLFYYQLLSWRLYQFLPDNQFSLFLAVVSQSRKVLMAVKSLQWLLRRNQVFVIIHNQGVRCRGA